MKFYLTEKFYKDTHQSDYYRDWEKELTDIWKPTYDGEKHYDFVFYKKVSSHIFFYNDKTFRMEIDSRAVPDKKGKRSVHLEDFNEVIERNVLILIKLVQHGYARLEE